MKLFSTILLSLTFSFSFCQDRNLSFPATWEGKWTGTLEVFKDTGKVQALPMELHVLPIDTASTPSWTWTIIYGSDKEKGKRPYELITLDAERGLYLIDEKNTIMMEGYYLGGQFYQWFEVQGSRLLTKTEKAGDTLIWEIVVSKDVPVSVTGDTIFEGEEIPAVRSFAVTSLQRAVLKRF